MIALAMQNYHDAYGSFPPPCIIDEQGTRIHSWRALLLPYLFDAYTDADSAARRYNMDEPWNGPENRKVVQSGKQHPYACPAYGSNGFTSYVAVTGPRTAWPKQGRARRDVYDGTSVTVGIIEYNSSEILWTEPRDLTLDEAVNLLSQEHPRKRIGHGDGKERCAQIALCDGAVRLLSLPVDRQRLIEMFRVDDSSTTSEVTMCGAAAVAAEDPKEPRQFRMDLPLLVADPDDAAAASPPRWIQNNRVPRLHSLRPLLHKQALMMRIERVMPVPCKRDVHGIMRDATGRPVGVWGIDGPSSPEQLRR